MNDIRKEYYDSFYNDRLYIETHFFNNKIHRENGPAIITYYENGNIKSVEYYKNGSGHRVYGPSDIYYNIDGTIFSILWFYNHKTYSIEVNKWLKENNFNSWKEMSESDFDRMWMEIL